MGPAKQRASDKAGGQEGSASWSLEQGGPRGCRGEVRATPGVSTLWGWATLLGS